MTIQPAGGDTRTVDSRYLDEGWLDHGYALTAHAAQGATVDRSFVLGSDDLYREWGYTALSRHRRDARFYVVSPGSSERALPGLEPDPDPLTQDLGAMLGPSRRKELAIDVADHRFLAREHRSPTAPARAHEQPDIASEEIEAARVRIAKLAEERDALGMWQRAKRKEIDKLLERQHEGIARWEAERAADADRPRMDATRPMEAATMSPDDVRAALVRPPAEIAARIGGRPDTLSEREQWCRAAANLLGRTPATTTLDLDNLADLGPEL